MRSITIPTEKYMEAASVFHWASMKDYQLWFTGEEKNRHRRSENTLKKLTNKGKLRAIKYGRKLVYILRNGKDTDEFSRLDLIVHGLACTRCLVRFYRADTTGTVVAEKYFRKLGSVPEGGILYPNGSMLLFEFATKDNFLFSGLMRGKFGAYEKNLEKIEKHFQTRCVVMFIIDIKRDILKRYVESQTIPEFVYLTDYETFLKVPVGQHLTSSIYFWKDAKEYPLR